VIWITTGSGGPMAASAMPGSASGFDAARTADLACGVARRIPRIRAISASIAFTNQRKSSPARPVISYLRSIIAACEFNQKAGYSMSTRLRIISEMQRIAAEQQVTLPPLDDDLSLHETGFDSLGFAILVARLEDDLGIDPFTISEDAAFPLTIGDFIRAYENVPA
jgi:acyl carrier protein